MQVYKTGYVLSLEEEKRASQYHLMNNSTNRHKVRTVNEISRSGSPYYRYVASASDTCGDCAALHGMAFYLSDVSEGINLPPLHPNCKCDIAPYNFEDELSANFGINDNPSGVSPNDWVFFGKDGEGFNPMLLLNGLQNWKISLKKKSSRKAGKIVSGLQSYWYRRLAILI